MMKLMQNILIALLLLGLGEGSSVNLTFMFITSFGQSGHNSSGAIPAAEMALEAINSNPSILPGYSLGYDDVKDSECHRQLSSDVFFDGIWSDPVKLAVVGCGCSVATEPVAEISHRWNIPQISYASGLSTLSDRTRFKRYFRNSPTIAIVGPALLSIMKYFNWTRIALLTQNEGLFTGAEASIRRELEPANITVKSRVYDTNSDPLQITDLFLTRENYRVFLVNSYEIWTRRVACEAKKMNLTTPNYVWIFYDWHPKNWWKRESDEDANCTDSDIEDFLERALSLRRYPLVVDVTSITDAGISTMDFEQEYEKRAKEGDFAVIDPARRVYDVMWILAIALNKTLTAVDSGRDINGTGCETVPGSLVPLENFTYSNEKMGCLIQWNIQQTNFSGVSNRVLFDEYGTRIHHTVRLRQYRFNANRSIERRLFAQLDERSNFTLTYVEGFDDIDIFPDGNPSDGSPIEIIHTFHIGLIVAFDFLATLGIAFAIACLFFNLIFRNRQVVKLSSPKLNYFIIAGAMLMYGSVYIYLLPSTTQTLTHVRCIAQYWLFTIGYSLIFGCVVAKMWRVHQVFHNPAPNKRVMKDSHLVAIILVVAGISLLLLFLWTTIPFLRGMVMKERDDENSFGETEYGVKEEYKVWVCYEASSPSYFWQIFIYAYLIMLQIVGIVLAFQTRKVKLQGLKDSKFIASIVYISSIILVILALVTFGLRTYINIGTGIFVAGIIILTTITLGLIFIPKMVLLYQGSEDETATSVFATEMGAQKQIAESSLEKKVVSLETAIKDKDTALAELKHELALYKGTPNGSTAPDKASKL